MDITHLLLDNRELGKISKEQRAAGLEVWKTELVSPDFGAFAQSCGALAIRVEEAAELDESLARAIEHDGPAMVHVLTDAELV
jgi:thiamine pyrophosphate-dependent acetolactate synthase large subunit-like protein